MADAADSTTAPELELTPPVWKWEVDANSFGALVRLGSALRAIVTLAWDGESDNGGTPAYVQRADLAGLISIMADTLEGHVSGMEMIETQDAIAPADATTH